MINNNSDYLIRTQKSKIVDIALPNQQYDERDTMFARMARKPKTEPYDHYYSANPGLKRKDDNIRDLTPFLKKGSKYYDNNYSKQARQLFDSIKDISVDETRILKYLKLLKGKTTYLKILKQIAIELGAVACGCTLLEQNIVYSHRGRFDDNYGQKIHLTHSNVIVFLVEMDFERMQSAPQVPAILESANQYYNAALISKYIENIIIKSGYKAKAHYDAHYDVILPPLAIQAGLGELGRNNILIAEKYGSRVRIGAVTTDLPLDYDKPISVGANRFCDICKKCAASCPSKALSTGNKSRVKGVEKWTTNVENCYSLWRKYGTDCGICMSVCPFSHQNNWFHNLIRKVVKFLPIFNRALLLCDDLLYGKKWRIK